MPKISRKTRFFIFKELLIHFASAAEAAIMDLVPAVRISLAQEFIVAPVVIISSTRRHAFP